jgi:ADP-heptose:LPS heptosyltransferase
MIDLNNKTVLISRTDSIGDVVLTLPMCVWIKKNYPTAKIIFLGNTYTKPVIECLPQIDEIIEWAEMEKMPQLNRVDFLKAKKIDVCIHVFPKRNIADLVKKAKIETRVGTSHRTFHLLSCNIRLGFSRKNSEFHESQLNFELLKPFGIEELPSLEEISSWMKNFKVKDIALPENTQIELAKPTKKVILHTKSQGSAMEWPIEKYAIVAKDLLKRGFSVIFTGTEADGIYIRSYIPKHENCIDTTGKLTLDQLINLISKCDTLVACSTGPLHLAGVLGLQTIGLYSPKRPIHPGRWKAVGENVQIVVNDEHRELSKINPSMSSIAQIESERVIKLIK